MNYEVKLKTERFACKMYWFHRETNINNAKYLEFLQNNIPKSEKEPISWLKVAEDNSIPNITSVLENKIQRCNFVYGIWNQATQCGQLIDDPQTAGCRLHNQIFEINVFEVDQLPASLQEILFAEDLVNKRGRLGDWWR